MFYFFDLSKISPNHQIVKHLKNYNPPPPLAEPTPSVRPEFPPMGQHVQSSSILYPYQNENEIYMNKHNDDWERSSDDKDDEEQDIHKFSNILIFIDLHMR